MIESVELFQVRNRTAAGSTPRSPKLEQGVVALAEILRQLVLVVLRVAKCHVGEMCASGCCLDGVGLVECLLSECCLQHLRRDEGQESLDARLVEAAHLLVECQQTYGVVAVASDERFDEVAFCLFRCLLSV